MKFLRKGFQKLEHEQDRQTDRQTIATKYITMPHSLVVKITIIRDVSDARIYFPVSLQLCF